MDETQQKTNKEIMKKWGMVNLATEFGFIIALPLVVFALIGKWLDHKFGTYPWLTLAGIVLAITLTSIWMTKRLKGYIK
jgi:F0F1-type ATP synthase assembly protein I